MNTLIVNASLACIAAGIVVAAIVLLVSRSGRLALRVALDLWLAAGLLRLALSPQWDDLLGVAAIIGIRQLAGAALTYDAGAGRRPAGD